MLDEFLIRHSAPTLAGLKTANLFWYPWENRGRIEGSSGRMAEGVSGKGIGSDGYAPARAKGSFVCI